MHLFFENKTFLSCTGIVKFNVFYYQGNAPVDFEDLGTDTGMNL